MQRARSTRGVGVIAVVVAALFSAAIFTGIFRAPFEPGGRNLVVEFAGAPQVAPGDQVRVAGKVFGKVESVEHRSTAGGARVRLSVTDDAGPLYADARARLRARTLLAGAFHVELDRGTPSAGPLSSPVIPISRSSTQVEIEDVTDMFRGRAVQGLRILPGELGDAFADPRPPAETFRAVADVSDAVTGATAAARGEKTGDLPRLVASAARTVRALDAPRDELNVLVSGAAATLEVTGRRSEEIRAALAAGPGVTDELTRTLPRLDRTLAVTRGLVSRLEGPVPDVAPTLRGLRPALVATDRLVGRADRLLRATRPALFELGRTGRKAFPLLRALEPSIQRTEGTILPYFARKDPHTGRSTSVMIGGTAAGFGGSSGQQDTNGHFIRFPATVGASSVYLPCNSSLIAGDAKSILACDTFNDALTSYLKYLPPLTPAPGKDKG